MGEREMEIRERMERDRDILRGLGRELNTAEMRAYGDELAWAAVEDGTPRERPTPPRDEPLVINTEDARFTFKGAGMLHVIHESGEGVRQATFTIEPDGSGAKFTQRDGEEIEIPRAVWRQVWFWLTSTREVF